MIVASLIVGALALVATVAWWVRTERRRDDRCVTQRVREAVIVTLKSGPTFSGVLFESDARSLVLVRAIEEQGQVTVDGELLLRWDDVAFVQKP